MLTDKCIFNVVSRERYYYINLKKIGSYTHVVNIGKKDISE